MVINYLIKCFIVYCLQSTEFLAMTNLSDAIGDINNNTMIAINNFARVIVEINLYRLLMNAHV